MNTDKRRSRIFWQGLIACVALSLGIGPGQAQAVCDPSTNGNHVDCITGYSGPEVCVDCHQNEARDMHGSVHYQQNGPTDFVTNIEGLAGERGLDAGETGINTYCGTHENSPRFTCAGCHVGNGRFPMAQSEFEKLDPNSDEAQRHLANIDCLTCHQELYKRFPDPTAGFEQLTLENVALDANGNLVASPGDAVIRGATPEDRLQGVPAVDPGTQDFQFVPADPTTFPELASLPTRFQMPITSLQAAQTVHPTSRQSCLSCHAGAAGADGAKRGDLSRENIAPSKTQDMHMSAEGANLTCSDCHDAGGHRMRGRGLDLRPNDVPERFTCENSGCHSDQPHGDFSTRKGKSRDKHAMKVACQTCHIPSYAKANVGTEVARDWQDPHLSQSACNGRGGWLPREDKDALGSASLIPSYAWFDGTSEVYFLGEPLDDVPTVPLSANIAERFVGDFIPGDPAYVLGAPNGDVTGGIDTKLYPMKEHWGKLARNDVTNELIGHSTFEFFRTGSICRAVAVGLGIDEVNSPESIAWKPGDAGRYHHGGRADLPDHQPRGRGRGKCFGMRRLSFFIRGWPGADESPGRTRFWPEDWRQRGSKFPGLGGAER